MATVFEEIGVVLQRVGQPIAISSSGNEIPLAPGDAIQVGWRIVTDGTSSLTIEVENRGLFDIGRNSVFVLEEGEATTELLTNIAADATSESEPDLLDAELIQALIAAGADPTAIAEATAAGGADGAGAGVGTIAGAPGVTVNPTTSFATVNSLSGGTSPDGGTGGTVTNFAVESTLEVTSASVLESGLPDGSSPDVGTRTATGSFTITDPNGLSDIDLIQIGPGVFERGDEFLTDLSELIGASVDVGFGIVTLTDFTATDPNAGTFTFSYELDETVDNDSVAGATDTEFEESFDIVVSDGNSLSATGTVSINIVDDVPELVSTALSADSLQVDETALAVNTPVENTVDFSGNFTVTDAGADGQRSLVYSLTIASEGVDSGVDTTTGGNVLLYTEGSTVEGRVGNESGAIAFRVSVDNSEGNEGKVTLEQSLSLKHPTTGTSYDEAISLNPNVISLTAVLTDGDDDTDTETLDLGAVISFKDDGPSAQVISPIPEDRSFSASDLTLSGEQSIVVKGFTISAGTYSGDVPSGDPMELRSLTNEQSGIGIAGGTNEIDVTEQEYIQIDFGEDVSRASIELGSLGGHYNAGANPDAQINVLLFKGGVQVPGTGTYEFDADDGSLVISGGKATLELTNTSEFDSIRVFTTQGTPGGVESTNSNFVLLGASINKAFTLSAGDNDGVAELTETSLGYGVKGGSNEVDVTNGEFIQVDFAASVTKVDLELDSLAGHYNPKASANAEIRVVLFNGDLEGPSLIFDPDGANGALLEILNRKATISIEEPDGFDLLKIYTDDGTDNRTPVNSNFTLKNVEILEYQDFAIPKTLVLDESPLPGGGDGVDSITEDFSTFFKAVTDEDYGADGEGSVGYSLTLSDNSPSTGLYALGENGVRGPEIILNQSGNVITGSAADTNYFTLTLNTETGEITFTQSQNIYHPDSIDPDDAVTLGLADGTLELIQTVTDGDGDTATASINLLGLNSVATFVIENESDVNSIYINGGGNGLGNQNPTAGDDRIVIRDEGQNQNQQLIVDGAGGDDTYVLNPHPFGNGVQVSKVQYNLALENFDSDDVLDLSHLVDTYGLDGSEINVEVTGGNTVISYQSDENDFPEIDMSVSLNGYDAGPDDVQGLILQDIIKIV